MFNRIAEGKRNFDPVFHSETPKWARTEIRRKKARKLDNLLAKNRSDLEKEGDRRLDYLKGKGTGT